MISILDQEFMFHAESAFNFLKEQGEKYKNFYNQFYQQRLGHPRNNEKMFAWSVNNLHQIDILFEGKIYLSERISRTFVDGSTISTNCGLVVGSKPTKNRFQLVIFDEYDLRN